MDRELLQRVNTGDLRARELLWDELSQGLAAALLRELRDNDLALELTQQTLAELLVFVSTRGELGEEPTRVWALVHGFAEICLKRQHKKRKRELWRADQRFHRRHDLQLLESTSVEEKFGEMEHRLFISKVIDSMSDELGQCLRLRMEGRTFDEIGGELGYSASTAERRWQTARQRFQRKYKRARRTPPRFRSPSPKTGS